MRFYSRLNAILKYPALFALISLFVIFAFTPSALADRPVVTIDTPDYFIYGESYVIPVMIDLQEGQELSACIIQIVGGSASPETILSNKNSSCFNTGINNTKFTSDGLLTSGKALDIIYTPTEAGEYDIVLYVQLRDNDTGYKWNITETFIVLSEKPTVTPTPTEDVYEGPDFTFGLPAEFIENTEYIIPVTIVLDEPVSSCIVNISSGSAADDVILLKNDSVPANVSIFNGKIAIITNVRKSGQVFDIRYTPKSSGTCDLTLSVDAVSSDKQEASKEAKVTFNVTNKPTLPGIYYKSEAVDVAYIPKNIVFEGNTPISNVRPFAYNHLFVCWDNSGDMKDPSDIINVNKAVILNAEWIDLGGFNPTLGDLVKMKNCIADGTEPKENWKIIENNFGATELVFFAQYVADKTAIQMMS